MATAGYLISRAAERPAVLSLMVTIVAVQFFGLGRPVLRYLERLSSHDFALRVLGRVRVRFFERTTRRRPARLLPQGRPALAHGRRCRRAPEPLSARPRPAPGSAPRWRPFGWGRLRFSPGRGDCPRHRSAGWAPVVPALSGAFGARRSASGRCARRALCGARRAAHGGAETVAFGAQRTRLGRVSAVDKTLVSLARRDALVAGMGDALGLVATGVTVVAVLAVAVVASGHGALDRVLIAMLALLALATFEAVTPLAGAARELSSTLAAGRRVLEPINQDARTNDSACPLPAPRWPFAIGFEHVRARYPRRPQAALDGLTLRLEPGERVALVGPNGVARPPSSISCFGFSTPRRVG